MQSPFIRIDYIFCGCSYWNYLGDKGGKTMNKLRPDTMHNLKLKYKNLHRLGALSPSFWKDIAPFLRWLIDKKGFDSHQIVSVVEEPYNYFELQGEFNTDGCLEDK